MPHRGGRLAAFMMSTLITSSLAFRPIAVRWVGRNAEWRRAQTPIGRRYFASFNTVVARNRQRRQQHKCRGQTGLPSMLLGVETGIGIVGLGALNALRLFTANIAPKRVRVVTDIDDTVKSSGNKRFLGVPLGGIDAQYDRGLFYPGVFQFSLELSRHRVPSWQEPLSVAVLTARAREFLFALEIGDAHQISKQFRRCGERNGLKSWGRGPVLYGSVREWIFPSRKSERKAKNFGMLVEDDGRGGRGRPSGAEGGYIFVGDTGEGDPRAGELMSHRYPERMRAVFLHVVSDAARQGKVIVPPDRLVNGVPTVYFRTYVGAAIKAVQLGLMDKPGLDNVVTAAKDAMLKIPPKSSKWVDMNKDLLKAEDVERLPPPLGVETLTLALDDALAPKNKLAGARVERRPALVATTRRVPGANVKPRA